MQDSARELEEVEFDLMSPEEFRDIQNEINITLADIRASRYGCMLSTLEISEEAAKTVEPRDFVLRKGQQLTGIEAALVIIAARAGAKVGSKVILDIWKGIIFPRLKDRYGPRVRMRRKSEP